MADNLERLRELSERLDRREAELEALLDRYETLVETMPIGLAVHDGRELLFVNTAFARMVKSTPGEVIGQPVSRFIDPSVAALVEARVREVLERGRPAPFVRERLVAMDGTTFEAAVCGSPIRFDGYERAVQALVLQPIDLSEYQPLAG